MPEKTDTHPTPSTFDSDDGRTEALLREMNRLPADDPRLERIRSEIVQLQGPVARSIARRYANRGEPLEDVEQAAMLGLVKAINHYDPELGDRFLAYAVPTMTGEVKRHFRDRTWRIRVPRQIQEGRIALREASRQFAHEHGRSPTVRELTELLELTEEEVIEVIAGSEAYQPVSLDIPVSNEEDAASLGELLGDDDPALELVIDHLALRPLIGSLPERERGILVLRFFGNKTQAQIAEQIGLSQMHVSRLIRTTLEWLRISLLTDP